MAKTIKVGFDGSKAEEGVKSLKTQLREARIEFEQLQNSGTATADSLKKAADKIDDISDKIDRAKFSSGQFEDKLASLPGPLGKLGGGLKAVGDSFATFGVGLTGILALVGLLVSGFFAIKNALGKTEEGTKLLSQATSAFNKVLAPLLAIFENLGRIILPYVTKGLEGLGAVMNKVARFFGASDTAIKETTASLEKNNEAANKLADDEEERAKKAKEAADKGEEQRKKNLENKLKNLETNDRLDAANLEKKKQEALALAKTEQEKLDVEKKFGELSYNQALKDLEDKQKLYKKDELEYKDLQTQIVTLQANRIAQQTALEEKQQALIDKKQEETRKKNEENDKKNADRFKKFIEGLKEQKDKQTKALEDNLSLEEKRLQALTQGTKEYFAQQRAIEDAAYKVQVDKAAGNAELLETLEKDHKKNLRNIDKAEFMAKKDLQLQIVNLYGGFGRALKELAGKNKKLAIAGLLIEQAAGIASIIINTQKAAAEAKYFTPLGIATLIAGAASVATAIAATVKGIKDINKVDTEGGGGAQSASSAAPPPTFAGGTQSQAIPQVTAGGEASPSLQIAQTLSQVTQRPLRAYVVSGEIQSQTALDRRTNRGATFNLG